ncbi:MAG: HAD-IIIC family phosphatase [Oscillatoriaceae bacterium SKW80]|nr:HAD-IIIC family phosphatase [Oscillatoriaceae bacterium SKYG93]MCX8119277.1 HAD-IIIC family phosphatase [Oscillatoriaceae bacterium SKW80]MDW8454744.1 HAD-IIIC family phosphatase [Oscillatoriaceae cyanobacterium SKYGB_i_bin93]HIK28475.1 HAD-IIIC family phosphatase [Oscillatoriaceae cyanobacterium M7585_C2015_266]
MQQKIAITATFTAEPVEESLAFWLKQLDIPYQINFAPYNQVFQQLFDPNSLLSQNQKGLNVILIRLEDWERQEEKPQLRQPLHQETINNIERNVRDLASALKGAAAASPTPQLVCICPASPSALADLQRQTFFKQMEDWLKSEFQNQSNIYIVTPDELAATYPVGKYYDPYGDELGHIPYTPTFFTALGTLIARKLYALTNPPYKVIVLDCDQTLWKGVCGEDGALGIEIDPPRRALQEFIVAQNEAGMLVCLCSKNNEEDVIEVFERRTDMLLTRARIISWRINWLPKSENIKSLAKELNLGLDSFIFIDDNPVECAEVQANCPQVLTLQLPVESDIPKFLKHVWAFDHLKVTEEDKKRTALYQENVKREQFRNSAASLEQFLEGLCLEIDISEMLPHQLPRVSQLTQRTNQFNFTTIRRSESEIQQLIQSNFEILTVSVRDRFGDYGLVGVIIFKSDSETLKVDTFLLSCRALGRGVEHKMLAKLGKIAEERHLTHIELYYNPTKKNQPALNFLESVAASFKQPTAEGLCFRLPKEVAAQVSYKPTTSKTDDTPLPEIIDKSPQIPASQIVSKHRTLLLIANELNDVEQILKQIELQKRLSKIEKPTAFLEPQTHWQKEIAEIWKEILGIDKVSRKDNFFGLGGDSLQVYELLFQIREKYKIDLEIEFIFTKNLEELAAKIEEKQNLYEQKVQAETEIAEILQKIEGLSEEEARNTVEQKINELLNWKTAASENNLYYCCADIERVPVGHNGELVYSRITGSKQILKSEIAEMISECQQFKTLAEHAREISSTKRYSLSYSEALQQLSELAKAGFLISQQQIIDKWKNSEEIPSTENIIASVGLITCNRIDGLKRALSSYIENCLQYERKNDFVVVDDSANPQTRNSYRQMLRALKNKYGVKIYYGGLEEKQHFAKALIKTGELPPEIVNFALFDVEKSGVSPGANRNALTLHCVGDMIFSADDDTVCRLVASPKLKSGLSFKAGGDPSEYWVFRDRQTALQSVTFTDINLLGSHEQLLGKNIITIFKTFANSDTPDFNQINTPFLRRLLSGNGRVLVSFNGLVGDCGWGAPFGFWGAPLGYLLFAGESHERLVRSETDYRAALTSRDILRVVNQTCISDDSFGMTTFLGLDNRQLLPPFLPVRRGQDLIFANSVWKCFPEAFFGHLPWALLHEPVETRKFWSGEIFRTASSFDTAKLIIECVKSCQFGSSVQKTGAERMRALGTHLIELGSMPQADFEEFVRLQVWRAHSSFIFLMEERLKACQEFPAFWANDIKKYIDLLSKSLIRDDYLVPLDLVEGRTLDEARELAQRLVLKFGQLLYYWPDIVAVTKKLRQRNQRLAIDRF